MLLTNQDSFADHEIIETLGIVSGNVVQIFGIKAGLKFLSNGQGLGDGCREFLTNARQEALLRMVDSAKSSPADGIVSIRFSTTTISESMIELLVVGTAVKLKRRL